MSDQKNAPNPPSPIQEILNQITVTTVYQVATLPKVSVEISEVEAALLEYIAETIGKDEVTDNNRVRNTNTCWACYEEDYCVHEKRDEFRADLRKRFGIEK